MNNNSYALGHLKYDKEPIWTLYPFNSHRLPFSYKIRQRRVRNDRRNTEIEFLKKAKPGAGSPLSPRYQKEKEGKITPY